MVEMTAIKVFSNINEASDTFYVQSFSIYLIFEEKLFSVVFWNL